MPAQYRRTPSVSVIVAVLAFAATTIGIAIPAAQAQTFTVLHNFSGPDGSGPLAGLTMDNAGNFYGTTGFGGTHNNGNVFKLIHTGSGAVLNPLYNFTGGADGGYPNARVIFGPDGKLYGTTNHGGLGFGTVFQLSPPASFCRGIQCYWTETVLYAFTGGSDGASPGYGDLVFGSDGSIYGTTTNGGVGCYSGCGVVFKLSRSGAGWTESVIYRFIGATDGSYPQSGVIFDSAGNLYGTSNGGLYEEGTVYKLTPSSGGWTKLILYNFANFPTDGAQPYGGLIFDQSGNLYGTTSTYGVGDGGTAFELSPSNGRWTFSVIGSFTAYVGSLASLAMDQAGNLYGTLAQSNTEVYKLTPTDGGWTQTGFSGSAGNSPIGNVIVDASGNVYGTAASGGTYSDGVVFEITQ